LPTQITSIDSAEHYKWGGPNGTDCEGWHLVKTPELSIIEELMPPGTNKARHSHNRARQFFFVLEGELTMEVARGSRFKSRHPRAHRNSFSLTAQDHGACSMEENLAQVAVATFTDAGQLCLAAGQVLLRHQSDPGGELSPLVERSF
jgi:hypothetical protein